MLLFKKLRWKFIEIRSANYEVITLFLKCICPWGNKMGKQTACCDSSRTYGTL